MQADEKTLIEFKLTLQCTGKLTSLLNNALSLPINYTAVKLFPQWSRHRSHHIQIISPNEVARHHVRDKSPGNGVFPITKICPGFYESLSADLTSLFQCIDIWPLRSSSQVPQPPCSWNPDTCQLGNLTQIFTKAIHMVGDGVLQCDPISCQEYQTQFHDSSPLVQSELGICNCKNSIYLFYPGYSWLRRPSSSHNDSHCLLQSQVGRLLEDVLTTSSPTSSRKNTQKNGSWVPFADQTRPGVRENWSSQSLA